MATCNMLFSLCNINSSCLYKIKKNQAINKIKFLLGQENITKKHTKFIATKICLGLNLCHTTMPQKRVAQLLKIYFLGKLCKHKQFWFFINDIRIEKEKTAIYVLWFTDLNTTTTTINNAAALANNSDEKPPAFQKSQLSFLVFLLLIFVNITAHNCQIACSSSKKQNGNKRK